ncbi:MAG: response regulator [Acidobacteria bacterium]|nr:response regulator [Acidobacteriota bacterium]
MLLAVPMMMSDKVVCDHVDELKPVGRFLGGMMAWQGVSVRPTDFVCNRVLASRDTPITPHMARILVVDDEAPIREILTRRLTQWGHDVVSAPGAEPALQAMADRPAEIVFCDVIMPMLDGAWLAQQIRERWPGTVVVAVSGAQDMATVMTMRRHGAVDYVAKPIGREMLHQALERALATLAARADRIDPAREST